MLLSGKCYRGGEMKSPDFILSYNEKLSGDLFKDFEKTLSNKKLSIIVEARPDEGPFACPEWFLPTAVMAYIGKPYFESFLSEMGKDHYHLLKSTLSKLIDRLMSKPENEPTLISSGEGKICKNNPFSLAFAFYADTNDGRKFKLLIPKYSTDKDYNLIIVEFMNFLENYYAGKITLKDIGFNNTVLLPSKDIFIHLNETTKSIEWLDQREYK